MWRSLFSRLLQCLLDLVNRISGGRSRSKRGLHNTNTDQVCSDLWSHRLQQEIIDLILRRLGVLDRIRFGAVCTHWRAAVATSMTTLTSPLGFPFILHGAFSLPNDGQSISSVDDNRYYYLNPLYTNHDIVIGSIEGRWLIISQKYYSSYRSIPQQSAKIITHAIVNPVTGKKFRLPQLYSTYYKDISSFQKMVASSEPTNSNCLVVGNNNLCSLSFCRLTDSEWTPLNLEDEFKDFGFHDIIFVSGKLYASPNYYNFILVFDLRQENENGVYKAHKIVPEEPWPISIRPRELKKEWLLYTFYDSWESFAVDLVSQELFFIICDAKILSKKHPDIYDRQSFKKMEVVSFNVYKMDIADDHYQWIEVRDLGDRMLFYGDDNDFFMSIKDFGESTHQGNCIYYAFQMNKYCWDVGKFYLKDRTIVQFPIKRGNAIGWFVPTTT